MSQMPSIEISVFGKTDVGLVREHNEDNFLVADIATGMRTNDLEKSVSFPLASRGALLLVCDGMGGAAAGEVASQMAVDSIYGDLSASAALDRPEFARLLRRSIERANDKIYAQSRNNQSERGMGTTCTAAALVDGTLVVGQIGDSRCYVVRDGRIAQVTKDQSLAWQLIEAGAMTPEEAKAFEHTNIILQALGVQDRVDVVLSQVELRRGDVVLVCSDGLHGPVSDEEILEIVRGEADLSKAGDALIAKALEREGPDNVTLVLARFNGPGLEEAAAEEIVGFVAYDPGPDPDADPAAPAPPAAEVASSDSRATVEAPVLSDVAAASEEPAAQPAVAQNRSRPGRPIVTLLLLAAFAALAGGVFVRCQQDTSPEPPAEAP